MSGISSTVIMIGIIGQALAFPQGSGSPVSAAISNACASTLYTAPTGSSYTPLSPGGLSLVPLDAGTKNILVTNVEGANPTSAALKLEWDIQGSTLFYDAFAQGDQPFAADGFRIGTADSSCPISDCPPNATECQCYITSAGGNSCPCGAADNSLTLTVCSG